MCKMFFQYVVICVQQIMQKINHSDIEQYVINAVRRRRIIKGISQKELAYLLEMSVGFIGNVENPKYRAKYNLNHINELAKILECSPKDFLPDKPL
jgi:transcriptional regulator with XRE-family HTH domain